MKQCKTTGVTVAASLLLLCGACRLAAPPQALPGKDYLQAAPEDLRWFREARLGLMVCWGPVSLKGTEIGWSRGGERRGAPGGGGAKGTVPVEEYDRLYTQFNPTKFDAAAWAAVARAAGMRYVVFLTKHHDGFCMFDSELTDYNVTRSPYGRDVTAEVAEAFRGAGLRLGFYYSQPDWHHPDSYSENHVRYIRYLHDQLRELCTRYGKVHVIWFDGLWGKAKDWDSENLFKMIRGLQPGVLINNRANLKGDFDTPEQEIGRFQTERAWETCMTLGTQWSWKPEDRIKSLKECIRILVACAGRDGNLLLNVGPMPTGEIEPRQVKRLREIGGWLETHGESIYGTRGGPYKPTPWFATTHRGDVLYVHVLRWPDDALRLPSLDKRVVSGTVLGGGRATVRQTAEGIEIFVAESDRREIDTVVALRFDGRVAEARQGLLVPCSLAAGKKAEASSVWPQGGRLGPERAFDGDWDTAWAAGGEEAAAWLEVDLEEEATFDRIVIGEIGERVREFDLQCREGDGWRTLAGGGRIGPVTELTFAPATARVIRLNIKKASGRPMIAEFQLLRKGAAPMPAAASTNATEVPRARCHPASNLVPLPQKITFETGAAPPAGPVAEDLDASRTDLGDEGYALYCRQEGYRLTARTQRGLFYGTQTLEQLKGLGPVPCCTIEDKPAMRMRAVMFDMARLKEKHEFYYRMIDHLAQWKINAVFLHLTDHVGCAIELKTHPRLATQYAFSQAEMKKLITYAADRHIELIPEIESWGHARWITNVPDYADLAESREKPGSLCTSNERTWELLGAIYREVAELFPSRYLHAGCDESSFGLCETCKAKVKKDGADALVGGHLRRACELVKAAGKTPMIWGDVLLQRRGSVAQVPRDAVICHWDYKADLSAEPVEFLKGQGFEVVGCPAVVWGSRMILPMADTWDNVAHFARIVLDQKCLGMETTIWIPQRYMSDTLDPALAHASEMSWSGPVRPRAEFMAAFAKLFYGMDPTSEITQALVDVHGLSIKAYSKVTDVGDYASGALASGKLDPAPMPEVAEQGRAIADVLRKARAKVGRHVEEYDSLILSAEVRAHVEVRAAALQDLTDALRRAKDRVEQGKRSEAAAELRKAAANLERLMPIDEDLGKRVLASWDRWRYADDPKKPLGGDNLAAGFIRSGEFLKVAVARLTSAADGVEKGEGLDTSAVLR